MLEAFRGQTNSRIFKREHMTQELTLWKRKSAVEWFKTVIVPSEVKAAARMLAKVRVGVFQGQTIPPVPRGTGSTGTPDEQESAVGAALVHPFKKRQEEEEE